MASDTVNCVQAYVPSVALRPFVRRILIIESAVAHKDNHLPDTGLVGVFRFRGDCLLQDGTAAPQAGITGIWDTLRSHRHSADCASAIVSFTPTGAAAILRQSLEEFANTTIPVSEAFQRGASLNSLSERLAAASDHSERFQIIERELLRNSVPFAPDMQVLEAVKMLEGSEAPLHIEALANRLGLSQSALERRFRRLVGTTPRRFASLVRLKRVVQYKQSGLDLTSIAHAAGYYDQSHFIKDFQRFAGCSPAAYFRA
ncbi:MAG: helix-turn-helix domain-containing protein [Armatimonas sp.]